VHILEDGSRSRQGGGCDLGSGSLRPDHYKGAVEDSTAADGAVVCRRDGSVVEGNIAGDGRSVDVYLVNADTDTATSLTPSFEKILSAVG